MKYLIFNIAVVVSLASIIWNTPEDKSQITEKFQSLIDDVKRSVSRSGDLTEKNRKVSSSSNKDLIPASEKISQGLLEKPKTKKEESVSGENRSQKISLTTNKTERLGNKKIKNSETKKLAKPLDAKIRNKKPAVSQKSKTNMSHFNSPLSEIKQSKIEKITPEQSIPISNDSRRRALLLLSEEMEIVHAGSVYE